MIEPDYNDYSIEELLDSKENIDKDQWPARFAEICERIEALTAADPEIKKQHDTIVFANFCEELRGDLTLAVDDDFLKIFRIFSKRAQTITPSTFEGEVCPICEGELVVESVRGGWHLECEQCDVDGYVSEYVTA